MKKLLFALGLLVSLFGKAQTVTIPDPNFAAWIQQSYPTCINGNQLDTACINGLNITNVSVYGNNISDLSGLEHFIDLQIINCGGNNIASLPSLPPTLINLSCYNNNLVNLPNLPNTLQYLSCGANDLISLPSLPNSLLYLDCQNSFYLNNLGILPNNLKSLSFSNTPISSLNSLPDSLEYIGISYTSLTSLPPLPLKLKALSCNNNNLISLPVLPVSLNYLNCSFNVLNTIPSLPNNLNVFRCTNNNLTSLPNLSQTITYMDCNNNNLTTLPSLPSNLIKLYCHNNNLNTLPNLPSGLKEIYCYFNNLTSLPNLPTSITDLSVGFNSNLTYLPYLPNSLSQLYISGDSNLTCLPNIPNALQTFIFGGSGVTCIPNYPQNNSWINSLPLCQLNSPNNPNNCSSIGVTGSVYSDANNNCIYNFSEMPIKNISVDIVNNNSLSNQQTSTSTTGNFGFTLVPYGNYIVKLDTVPTFLQNCTSSHVINLTASNSDTSNLNFGLQCKPNTFDLGVKSILPSGPVFPGQQHTLKVFTGDLSQFFNFNCTASQNISATLTVNVSGPVQYVSPAINSLTPSSVVGNVLTYSIPNISYTNLFFSFNSLFVTDTSAQAGDSVCVTVTISTPQSGDVDPLNNTYKYCYLVVNSYDPNIKVVNKEVVKPSFNDWLTYTIYFQNTGNAQAYNIKLVDTLDNALDLNTFEVIGYSHENSFNLNSNTKQLVVNYPNILLPDSTSNPLGSIGYIQYRIKPSAPMALNNQIKNKAGIYFDFNAPIITNTVTTTATNSVGLTSLYKKDEAMRLSPNPASQSLQVVFGKEKIDYVSISELSGKVLLKKKVNIGDSKIYFDLSQIENGLYLVNGYSGEKIVKGKKLVVRK